MYIDAGNDNMVSEDAGQYQRYRSGFETRNAELYYLYRACSYLLQQMHYTVLVYFVRTCVK
jgi:hypothetical protein